MASSPAPALPAPTAAAAHSAPPTTTAAAAPPATARTRREEEGTEEERERRCPAGDGGHDAEAVAGVVHGADSLLVPRPVPIQARPLLLGPSPPLLRACTAAGKLGPTRAATGQLRLACVRRCKRERARERESRDFFVGSIWNRFIGVKGSLVFSRS
jgi:hypothetical protein